MDIEKGTRRQKIIGTFGEWLVCNWLSRSGFEVAVVDHTGIDLIAYHPALQQRLGITVTSRTRTLGSEAATINRVSNGEQASDRQKLLVTCAAFASDPWLGIYGEASDGADLYFTSLTNYDATYCNALASKLSTWRMDAHQRQRYDRDPLVNHTRLEFAPTHWWGQAVLPAVSDPASGC